MEKARRIGNPSRAGAVLSVWRERVPGIHITFVNWTSGGSMGKFATGGAMPHAATLQSRDILAGLGAAPREMLATCLALFEDRTLQQRLGERVEELKRKVAAAAPGHEDTATVSSLQRRAKYGN